MADYGFRPNTGQQLEISMVSQELVGSTTKKPIMLERIGPSIHPTNEAEWKQILLEIKIRRQIPWIR